MNIMKMNSIHCDFHFYEGWNAGYRAHEPLLLSDFTTHSLTVHKCEKTFRFALLFTMLL